MRKYLKITYLIKVNIQSMFNNLQPNLKKKPNLKSRQKISIDISPKIYTQVVNWHMQRCSTSLGIKEMLIKTTMRHHFTPMRMTIISLN